MVIPHHTRRRKPRSTRSCNLPLGRSLRLESLEDRRLLAAAATIQVFPMGSINNSSTASPNSFQIYNHSTDARKITSVSIDLRTSLLPDVVYDPNGTGGDVVGIPFTPNTGAAATGQSTHAFSLPRDGGFDVLTVNFTDFDPGEMFGFRVDLDPTSVKGSAQPGPSHAASISGLELSGAIVTVQFSDDSMLAGQLFALEENASFYKVHSEATLTEEAALAAPSISLVGVGSAPAVVQTAAQTVRIAGPVGAAVRLLQTEVALHLDGVPGGGFDIDPLEGNKVVLVSDKVAVIGAAGFVDLAVTLTDSLTAGGLTYLAAVIDAGDRTGDMSNILKVALFDLPPGSNPAVPIPGDFDNDSDVDGADFLVWQRQFVTSDDLDNWQENFGDAPDEVAAVTAASVPSAAFSAGPVSHRSSVSANARFPQPLGAPRHSDLIDGIFDELGGGRNWLSKLRTLKRRSS